MGKAYAHRGEVVKNDLYHTPQSLTNLLLDREKFKKGIDEPACGQNSIVDPLLQRGYKVFAKDIVNGHDFLEETGSKKPIDCITNPPFYLWDDFVNKAKELGYRKFAFIGRPNYFGTYQRYESGIFQGLKKIYVFNRYVDYQTPLRPDGLFHVGAMLTGWFVWERGYKGKPTIEHLNVQPWAKLGGYDPFSYMIYQHLGIEDTWTPDMPINGKLMKEMLQDQLQFVYTMKEDSEKCTRITDIVRITKKANKDRSFINLKEWSRV